MTKRKFQNVIYELKNILGNWNDDEIESNESGMSLQEIIEKLELIKFK